MQTNTSTKSLYSTSSSAKPKEYDADPLPQALWFNLLVYVLQTKTSAEQPYSKEEIKDELFKIVPFDKDVRRLLDAIPIIDNSKNIEDVYDTIAAVYGGRIISVKDKRTTRYYFEPFINSSDLNMIKGSILSDKYLSNKEKDYLTSVEDLLCPIQAERELTEASNLIRPASIDKSKPYGNWFYSIQTIFEAIKYKFQLELTYGEYYFDTTKKSSKPKFRVKNANEPYIVNPYALLWNNGHQYLVATTNEHETPCHYRIDRIDEARIHKANDKKGNLCPVKRNPIPVPLHSFYKGNDREFDAEKYTSTFPLMISASDSKHFLNNVVLECDTSALSLIIDNFGHDIKISLSDRKPLDILHGTVKTVTFCKVELKRVCYESILLFCLQHQASVFTPFPRIVALGPPNLVEEIKTRLENSLKYYKDL